MARRVYVDGPYGQLHARIAGTRLVGQPSLVCFHMSPMSSRTFERFLDAVAATGRHAIAIDTPGFGMSDGPTSAPAIADYANAMLAAIDALAAPGRVDLMGYHTGSMIALELAATQPARIRRVVCISTPIFTDAERAALRDHYAPEPPTLDGSHLVTRWNSFVHHHLGRGTDLKAVADAFPERLLGRANGWWGHRAAFDFAPDLRLPDVAQPVLVINCGDDLQEYTWRAAPLLRNGVIVERPAWGHGFLDASTADAVALAEGFLAAPDTAPFESAR
ncbi:MAG: alpha/beta hydrolase [Sphingomonas sp.]|nr:alpha/beta hydrolase [Sphingomonas sp.]